MNLSRYLSTRYVPGGRDGAALDCWGMTRLARAELRGGDPLPLLAAMEPGNLRGITKSVQAVGALGGFQPCAPRSGAIATGWAAALCVHIGLVVEVDGRLWVLETDAPTGPVLTSIRHFSARYSRAIFYDDQHLPRPDARPAD